MRDRRTDVPTASTAMDAGFTLIELLITLSVIGILSVIAVPSYQMFVETNRLASATNDFVADVSYARIAAMKGQGAAGVDPVTASQVVMCASSTGTNCTGGGTWASGWIVFWDQDGDGAFNAAQNDVLLKVHDSLPSSLATTPTPAGTLAMSFNHIGILTSVMNSVQIASTKINRNRLVCLSGGTGRAMIASDGVACP
jgi:prepilin-type N-terminal cleavage/methylation domain-containing protein